MLRLLLFLVIVISAMSLSVSVSAQASDYRGFRVVGAQLYDGDGEPVVLVGVNKMIIWTDIDGTKTLAEIAQSGANALRIVWLTSGSARQLDMVITNTVAQGIIPVIDCHDSTGDWSKFESCVNFWLRPDILAVIQRHERYLLINIANEPDPGNLTDTEYRSAYTLAVTRLRAAGIRVPLIIDAQGYAGRIDNLQRNAPFLMQVDPLKNLIFSIHIYWSTKRFGDVDAYADRELRETVALGIPLIIGEYSAWAVGCEPGVPYKTVLTVGHELGIGRFAWEWGPGNLDCGKMDMSEDGTFAKLREWGLEVAITHPQSIKNTAKRPRSMLGATPAPLLPPTVPDQTLADLVVAGITWTPETPVRNAEVTFAASVGNAGNTPLPAGTRLRVTFSVNGDMVGTGESTLTEPLSAQQEITVRMGTPWKAKAGEMIVLAHVEAFAADALVAERDHTNNFAVVAGGVKLFASS